ncbi:hypothetical protein N1F89_09930 [Aquibium sp. A9E412]|uniref:hypothetical protein n=1 Tax=Aquibium sp. A9E412 TaxID=2976767 RepID=UPI0025AFAEDE|nr:hypothetical protein [Aquibium sp. A9E412]MDN2566540.1 hypothetical protein [Aquibium sp. A9E412]
MFKTLRIAALSALVGLGTLAAMPATAQADGFSFSIGGNGARAGVHIGESGHSYRRAPRARGRHCTPHRAVNKAERLGVRRARVVRANRRAIVVRGRLHHRPVRIVFARAPRCPIVSL